MAVMHCGQETGDDYRALVDFVVEAVGDCALFPQRDDPHVTKYCFIDRGTAIRQLQDALEPFGYEVAHDLCHIKVCRFKLRCTA